MKLNQLLHGFFDVDKVAYANIDVTGICTDTREVKDGHLFILQKGEHFDSHDKYKELEQKVSAFISEREIDTRLPYFVVNDANDVIGPIAAKFYGNPTESMVNIAITGTNGKTSVASIISHILQRYQKSVGLIGTNGIFINDKVLFKNSKTPTTPPPLDIQKISHELRLHHADYTTMEVTSHGLHFDRTKGIDFKYRVFTNLTVDHLDFHQTMDEYFNAKSKLFTEADQDEYCILNKDTSYFHAMKEKCNGRLISYGTLEKANFRASNIELNEKNTLFDVTYQNETVRMKSSLIGAFNISNLLAAIAVTRLEGIPLKCIQSYIESFHGIDGRMERIVKDDRVVVVDFAHTPDALEKALQTLSDIKRRKLITVFGCGGDRDDSKRPLMGEIAERYSDVVIVTSDNPRTEDPDEIMNDIAMGMIREVVCISDRREAIHLAIKQAYPGDIILIAGKGHEKTQIIGTEEFIFVDVAVAKEALKLT